MRFLKKPKMKRQLNKNEKVLLLLLGMVIIFWAVFRFIITPQINKLQNLTEQKYKYEEKISHMNNILKNEKKIDDKWSRLKREKSTITNKYFSKMDQPQIIYLLNEMFDNEEFDVLDINFNNPYEEEIDDLTVRAMDINIPYKGTYDGLAETVKSIVSSPKKILIQDLIIDRDKDGQLVGDLSLKVYSLEGILELEEDLAHIDTIISNDKSNPFSSFDDYKEDKEEETEEAEGAVVDNGQNIDVAEISPNRNEVLEDFEGEGIYFIPSGEDIKGNVSKSAISKSQRNSLRIEYNMLAVEDENRAYIDLTDKNITIKYPPDAIKLWVYSYDYSPAVLGIDLREQMGEDEYLPLTEGIGWTGWKQLEVIPPADLNIYPLTIKSLYLEMPKNRQDFGVILVDKLEAVYSRNIDEDGKDNSIPNHIFHIVEKGDSAEKISLRYYGNKKYINEIMKLNELKSKEPLPVGKVLVLKKR